MGNAVWQGTGLGSLEARDLGSNPSFVTYLLRLSSSQSLYLCIYKMVRMVIRHRLVGSSCRFREMLCVRT